MNNCGNCTLCCKLLGVKDNQGFDKPQGKWCEHCDKSNGCKIYDTRPEPCKTFECGWLVSNLDISYRPDYLHVIFTGATTVGIDAEIIHCDPNYPDAYKNPKLEKIFNGILDKKAIILTIGDKRKLLSNNPRDAEIVNRKLAELER